MLPLAGTREIRLTLLKSDLTGGHLRVAPSVTVERRSSQEHEHHRVGDGNEDRDQDLVDFRVCTCVPDLNAALVLPVFTRNPLKPLLPTG